MYLVILEDGTAFQTKTLDNSIMESYEDGECSIFQWTPEGFQEFTENVWEPVQSGELYE